MKKSLFPRWIDFLTQKTISLIGIALCLVVGGVALKGVSLELASIPIISYVLLSLYFSSDTSPFQLEVRRIVKDKTVYEDQAFDVTVEIYNRGASKIDLCELYDIIPEGLFLKAGSNHMVFSLWPKKMKSFSYSVEPIMYGEFSLGPIRGKVGDFLDSNAEFVVLDNVTNLRVLPKISYLPKLKIRPRRTRNWPGEIVSRKKGQGLEFYGISDYSEGDPVKRINWKVSSRFEDKLQTNQFMSELGGDTVIVVDARRVSDVGRAQDSTQSNSIRAAAIISYRLLRDRNRVGLLLVGESLTKILPGFGKRQFHKIVFALSKAKTSTDWEIRSLGKYISIFFSRMVQIVFISSLADDESLAAIEDIAARGYSVLVISPSPLDAEKAMFDVAYVDIEHRLGERLAQMERENKLTRLRRFAPVIDWRLSIPLSVAMSRNSWELSKSQS